MISKSVSDTDDKTRCRVIKTTKDIKHARALAARIVKKIGLWNACMAWAMGNLPSS
jgi:hypothetical protein